MWLNTGTGPPPVSGVNPLGAALAGAPTADADGVPVDPSVGEALCAGAAVPSSEIEGVDVTCGDALGVDEADPPSEFGADDDVRAVLPHAANPALANTSINATTTAGAVRPVRAARG